MTPVKSSPIVKHLKKKKKDLILDMQNKQNHASFYVGRVDLCSYILMQ